MEDGLFTREDVAIPWSDCVECTIGTRSHLLKPALYNEYVTQQIIDQADEYANKQWEDVEDVVKIELAEGPVVICHKCWSKKQQGFDKLISKEYATCVADPSSNIITIQRLLRTFEYYKFEIHMDKMRTLLDTLKGTHSGEEE